MDGNLIWFVLGAMVWGALLYKGYLIFKYRKFKPPVIDEHGPEEVDGVFIGRYYGDPSNKICVEVVTVEDGVVAFRHLSENINSMPKEAFLEKYYKYPNGCEFPEIETY